jgi:hypothetical protein
VSRGKTHETRIRELHAPRPKRLLEEARLPGVGKHFGDYIKTLQFFGIRSGYQSSFASGAPRIGTGLALDRGFPAVSPFHANRGRCGRPCAAHDRVCRIVHYSEGVPDSG